MIRDDLRCLFSTVGYNGGLRPSSTLLAIVMPQKSVRLSSLFQKTRPDRDMIGCDWLTARIVISLSISLPSRPLLSIDKEPCGAPSTNEFSYLLLSLHHHYYYLRS